MKRDTRNAFRSRVKSMDGIVSAAVAEMKTLKDAAIADAEAREWG